MTSFSWSLSILYYLIRNASQASWIPLTKYGTSGGLLRWKVGINSRRLLGHKRRHSYLQTAGICYSILGRPWTVLLRCCSILVYEIRVFRKRIILYSNVHGISLVTIHILDMITTIVLVLFAKTKWLIQANKCIIVYIHRLCALV